MQASFEKKGNIRRIFLNAPALKHAASELSAALRAGNNSSQELTQALVVLPSARSARIFTAHLEIISPGLGENLKICTPGELIESILETARCAPAAILPRIWEAVLEEDADNGNNKRNSDENSDQYSDNNLPRTAAQPLAALRDELSSAGFDCKTLLEQHGAIIPAQFAEQFARIAKLETRYEELLTAAGLAAGWSGDRWMVRRAAWQKRVFCAGNISPDTFPTIWLIACAELSPFLETVLAEYPGNITACIAAPAQSASEFNDFGVLVNGEGQPKDNCTWDMTGEFSFKRVASLLDAAKLIAETAADKSSNYTSVIGVINRADRHVLKALLNEHKIECRDGHGESLSTTAPLKIIQSLLAFHQTASADEAMRLLLTLARSSNIAGAAEAGAELDQFIAREIPISIVSLQTPGLAIVKPLLTTLNSFLSATSSSDQFLQAIEALFKEPLNEAAFECMQLLKELLPLMCSLPQTDITQALNATVAAVARAVHEPRGTAPKVELFGWLELFLDESETVELINPSSDLIPGASQGNPFLPESLRRVLGLGTQESRANRDRYRFWYITNSGRNVNVTLQTNGARGEPLLISPCFLPISDAIRTANILLTQVESADGKEHVVASAVNTAARNLVRCELPAPGTVSVSGLADYLACPYRFALQHILKLKSVPDTAHEFDALHFGSILHAVLDHVAKLELSGVIFKSSAQLNAELQKQLILELQFHEEREGGVIIQTHSLSNRLAAYAEWHIEFREEGNIVIACEWPFKVRSPSGLIVKGRIDRIERNQKTGEVTLLDFKTSENAKRVDTFHRPNKKSSGGENSSSKNGNWASLQLPVYRMGFMQDKTMLQSHDKNDNLKLALLFIDGTGKITLHEASWDTQDYTDAEEQFNSATAKISAGEFWPPAENLKFDPFPFINLFHVV